MTSGRDLPLLEARRKAEAVISTLGLAVRSKCHRSVPGVVTTQLLSRADQQVVSWGAGKGASREAATVEALFSALQNHFVMHYRCYLTPYFIDGRCSAEGADPQDIPFSLISSQPGKRLAALEYETLGASRKRLRLPLALSNPVYAEDVLKERPYLEDDFDYRMLTKYASPTGIAIGSTLEEAVLHALYENVERYCLGALLLTQAKSAGPDGLNSVRENSLPRDIRRILATTRRALGVPVTIIDLGQELGLPVYMAYLDTPLRYQRQFGLGCSLCARTALIRAIARVMQLSVYKNDIVQGMSLIERDNRKYQTPFESDPLYRPFSFLEIGDNLRQYRDALPQLDFHDDEVPASAREQLQIALSALSSHGRHFYYTSSLAPAGLGISCVHGYLLPLDFTFLLSRGVKISLSRSNLARLQTP